MLSGPPIVWLVFLRVPRMGVVLVGSALVASEGSLLSRNGLVGYYMKICNRSSFIHRFIVEFMNREIVLGVIALPNLFHILTPIFMYLMYVFLTHMPHYDYSQYVFYFLLTCLYGFSFSLSTFVAIAQFLLVTLPSCIPEQKMVFAPNNSLCTEKWLICPL